MPAELLPLMDIRKVNFHGWQLHCADGVAQGIAVMGEGSGIYDDAVCPLPVLVNEINNLPFMVGLENLHLRAMLLCKIPNECVDLVES